MTKNTKVFIFLFFILLDIIINDIIDKISFVGNFRFYPETHLPES